MTSEQLEHLRRVLDTNSLPAPDAATSDPNRESRCKDVHTVPEISLGTLLRVCTDHGPTV